MIHDTGAPVCDIATIVRSRCDTENKSENGVKDSPCMEGQILDFNMNSFIVVDIAGMTYALLARRIIVTIRSICKSIRLIELEIGMMMTDGDPVVNKQI